MIGGSLHPKYLVIGANNSSDQIIKTLYYQQLYQIMDWLRSSILNQTEIIRTYQTPVVANEWCKYEKWYFSDKNTRLPKPIGILTPVQLLKSPKRTLLRLAIRIILYLFLRNRKVKKYYLPKKYKVTPLQQAEYAWKRNYVCLF